MFATTPAALSAQLDPRSTRKRVRTPSLDEMVEVFDFEVVARDNINRAAANWTGRGRDAEWSLRRNRIAFDWVDIVERGGVTPDQVDTSTTVLGSSMAHPIFACPSTAQAQMHPSGDAGMYQGFSATGGLTCIASGSSIPHAEVVQAADGPRWNQIYIGQNLENNGRLMQGWRETGSQAIAITIDHTAA